MAVWQPPRTARPSILPRRDRRVLHAVGAIAALLLTAGLILRGTVALQRFPEERIVSLDPTTGAVTETGIELAQRTTRPMFPDVNLDPGVPLQACTVLQHRGREPVDTVLLRISESAGSSRLLALLQLRIERGERSAGPDCESFEPSAVVVDGTLGDLSQDAGGWPSWTPIDGDRASYRFTVLLPEDVPDDLQAARARVDFLWAATAEPVGDSLRERVRLLTFTAAQDALMPMLLLLVLAVLFLGVQDRIDRRDPKLARAAVHEEPESFRASSQASVRQSHGR